MGGHRRQHGKSTAVQRPASRASIEARLAELGVGAMALFMAAVALWGLGALLHAGVSGG